MLFHLINEKKIIFIIFLFKCSVAMATELLTNHAYELLMSIKIRSEFGESLGDILRKKCFGIFF